MKPKSGIAIMLGVGPKSKSQEGPPPFGGRKPSMDEAEASDNPTEESGEPAMIGPADVDYSDNDLCESCANMQGDQCAKYKFPVMKTGHCEAGYEPKAGGEEMGAESDGMDMGEGGDMGGEGA